MWHRLAGIVAIIGLLLGTVGGMMMMFPPRLQQVLQRPAADVAVVVVALGTAGSLVLWARQPGHRERRAFVGAITGLGGLVVIANLLAPLLGWWGGPVFGAPLLPLALLTGLKATAYFSLLLLLYRWLAARRPWLGLLVYLLILLALVPATVMGDEKVLRSGVLAFGGGYRIWHDVLLGESFFALPLILYEAFRRCQPAPA